MRPRNFVISGFSKLVAIVFFGGFQMLASYSSAEEVDLDEWGYKTSSVQPIIYDNNILKTSSTGEGAWILSPPDFEIDEGKYKYISIKMKVSSGEFGQMFWSTDENPEFSDQRYVDFPIISDGEWHVYNIDPSNPGWSGNIKKIRLHPSNVKGADIEIAGIQVVEAGDTPKDVPVKE